MTRRRVALGVALVTATVIATVWVQGALAGPGQSRGSGSPTTTRKGKAVTQVRVVRNGVGDGTSSTTFVNVFDAVTDVTVPDGTRALLLIEFSAESYCDGVAPGDWCALQITVHGVEAEPSDGIEFAFDAPHGDDEQWESNSMQRSTNVLDPGTYTVRVRFAVTDAALFFYLDDWHLTVMRVRV